VSDDLALVVARPGQGEVLVVSIPGGSPAREALVVLDELGAPRAYANLCQHVPIPLDAGGRRFLDGAGLLACVTHGALYRRSDGLCVSGPCLGRSLIPLPIVEREDGRLEIRVRP
jgi:nitrite reductase/ring-hydroxylating ferredoxin subunit